MELREKLALHLEEISFNASTDDMDEAEILEAEYTAIADECIRQMERARTQDKVLCLHHGGATVDFPPLTLAPDDWKPE